MDCWNWLKISLAGWLRLNWADRLAVCRALALLAAVALQLRFWRFQTVHRRLAAGIGSGPIRPIAPARCAAYAAALRRAPYGRSCLPRALTFFLLARREGWPAELKLGVTRTETGVQAHAWVTLGAEAVPYFAAAETAPFPAPLLDTR